MGLGKTFTTLSLIYKNLSLKAVCDTPQNCIKMISSEQKCNCLICNKIKLKISNNEVLGGTLIVLPTSLLKNWNDEIKK